MASENRLDLADWGRRSPEFGALREYDDGRPVVAMEYQPEHLSEPGEWLRLRELWLDLPPHPHILDALDEGDDHRILLRYAALHWDHPPARLSQDRVARDVVAKWGAQLTSAYQTIWTAMHDRTPARFFGGVVGIDLCGAVRLGFRPVASAWARKRVLPPEVRTTRSRCDPRAFVYAVGSLVQSLCDELDAPQGWQLRDVIDQCLRPTPNDRYQSLDELQAAWKGLSTSAGVRSGDLLASWSLAEEGLGWLALNPPAQALPLFTDALAIDPKLRVAELGVARVAEALGGAPGEVRIVTRSQLEDERSARVGASAQLQVATAIEQGRRLEAERAFRDALALYLRVPVDAIHDASIDIAIARCHLALGAGQHAVGYAQRALAIAPDHGEAHALHARGCLLSRRFADALAATAAWLEVAAEDAGAHYVRGRALFGLGRYWEARDAFDRAAALAPQMVEAMLLRREADRALRRVRGEVGVQPAIEIELPEYLAEVRGALGSGRIHDALEVLDRPAYHEDPIALLVRARCLAFEKRFEEAVAVYDRLAELSSGSRREVELGRADALLALGRADEALALFDRVIAETPGDLVAIEGRALALRQLGRDAEAEDALGKVVAASGGRSDLRVGSVRP